MPKNKKGELLPWMNSKAKKLLLEDLLSRKIPLDTKGMGPRKVYNQRPEFAEFEYGRFRDRLRDLRRTALNKKEQATSESAALAHDRRIHPKATHNYRGEPRWEGSAAERLLRLDMDAKKHERMKPSELHCSRNEYSDYPLKVFRKHIHQEECRRKYIAYLNNKNNS